MRTFLGATVATLALVVGAPVASADPPMGDPSQHPHHVMTPQGCVPIDSVWFNIENRGLHRGANASGARGPTHGPCP